MQFKFTSVDCTAEDTVVRDQIIISLKDNNIRQEALKRSWELETLRQEGMKMESTARGGAEINGEDVYKMGSYSFKSLNNNQKKKDDANRIQQDKGAACYNYGNSINGQIRKHKSNCPAQNCKCYKCKRMGHFGNVCKSAAEIKKADEDRQLPNYDMKNIEDKIYNVNLSRISSANLTSRNSKTYNNSEFKVEVIVNNTLTTLIADTGAKVSIFSL